MSARRRRGMLTSMVKYPKAHHKHRETPGRKVFGWVVGGVIVGGLAIAVIAMLVATLFPGLLNRTYEGDFKVVEINDHPAGYDPSLGYVAAAVVMIEDTRVKVPLTTEQRAKLRQGTVIRVKYIYSFPRTYRIGPQDWSIVSDASPEGGTAPPGETPGPAGPTPAPSIPK